MTNECTLTDVQRQIFEKIAKNETGDIKTLLMQNNGSVNFADENGMTPLQHACYKGNKEIVQMLVDQCADVNYCQHGANYTSLHFAALNGNADIVLLLLEAGVKPNTENSVNRTAAQMAAFVGNHHCVAVINNYVPKSEIEYYARKQGQQTEPYLSPMLVNTFHKFVIQVNLHPVRIALNLQKVGTTTDQLRKIQKVLELMTEREIRKKYDRSEVMAFKYHYLGWIVGEIIRCQEHFQSRRDQGKSETRHDFVEMFAKRVLKENKAGQPDYIEYTIRDCAREFPFRECTIFRQVVSQLANPDAPPALEVLKNAINGHRGFVDDITYCSSCGEEKPDKKCSKCKEVQYCDRECQRLHWFVHKKTCARPISSHASSSDRSTSGQNNKSDLDTNEIAEQLQGLVAS